MNETAVQRNITAFWDAVASQYDTTENANVAAPGSVEHTRWVEAVRTLLPEQAADVLDVGTGTGFLARIAAELGHRVTAIDLSTGMLDASLGRDDEHAITFAVGDAVDPPYPPGGFDAVMSRSLIWTLREPTTAFGNWYHLLRPGGWVLALYGLAPTTSSDDADSDDHELDVFQRHYNRDTQAHLPAMHLADHDPLFEAAAAAGFCDVTTTALEALRGWETSPGSNLPYALVGYRSADP